MKYQATVPGIFIARPNRFIAQVQVAEQVETVHVKNTGRCKELLIPGVRVVLEVAQNPNRKTKYDLIGVYKEGVGLINMDSQAPNKVTGEWLATKDFSLVKPEYTYGQSRIDFYMEKQENQQIIKYLLEVKGCTLEKQGIGYFPDAPTQRGTKHLRELTAALKAGYRCGIAYVIQIPGVTEVLPNSETDPEYAQAMSEAIAAGVEVFFLCTEVQENQMDIHKAITTADW